MKKYVVAVVYFYESEIKQFKVEEENEYKACKKALIEFTPGKYLQSEIDWQNSTEFPQDLKGLIDYYNSADIYISIIEISAF